MLKNPTKKANAKALTAHLGLIQRYTKEVEDKPVYNPVISDYVHVDVPENVDETTMRKIKKLSDDDDITSKVVSHDLLTMILYAMQCKTTLTSFFRFACPLPTCRRTITSSRNPQCRHTYIACMMSNRRFCLRYSDYDRTKINPIPHSEHDVIKKQCLSIRSNVGERT